jgi:hypothetical protein
VLVAFMDTRLSGAFMLSTHFTRVVLPCLNLALAVRKYFVRYLMLPRYSTLQVFGEENAAGYRPMLFWEIEPWYVASSKSCSWLYSVYTRFFELPIAGDSKFKPEGYKLQEIGPKYLEGKGEEVLSFVKKNKACAFTTFGQFANTVYTRGGCPLDFAEKVKGGCPVGSIDAPLVL